MFGNNLKNKPKTAKVKIKKRVVPPNPIGDSLSGVGGGNGNNLKKKINNLIKNYSDSPEEAVPVGYDPVVDNLAKTLTNTTLYNSKNKEKLDKFLASPATLNQTPAPVPAAVAETTAPTSVAAPVAAPEAEAAPVVAPEANQDIATFEEQKQDILTQLKSKIITCKNECKKLEDEYKILHDLEEYKIFSDFSLPITATLFNLLTQRILDPSPDWKNKIDVLINIPTSLKSEGENINRGGDYMEALFQLLFAINEHPRFKGKYITFFDIENYNNLIEYEGSYLYTKTVLNSGGSKHVQGISDITFQISEDPHKKNNTKYKCGNKKSITTIDNTEGFYFFSIKGFLTERSVKGNYDIPLLFQQVKHINDSILNGAHITNLNICVGVKDSDSFRKRLDSTRIGFLPKTVRDNVFGYNEMMDCFKKYRRDFFMKNLELFTPENIQLHAIEEKVRSMYEGSNIIKEPLSLYFHQELVTRSVLKRIETVKQKEGGSYLNPHFMCIGVLPRGGKSFIAGGIINLYKKLLQKDNNFNVLFLTSAVSETKAQFKDDLINHYSDFSDFKFIDIRDKTISSGVNNFFFVSRQFATGKQKVKSSEENNSNDENEFKNIYDIINKKIGTTHIDLVFFDEAHIAITTPKLQKTFINSFSRFKAPIILMTATYKKPASILKDRLDLFIWDLFDIKDMRTLPEIGYDLFMKKQNSIDVLVRYGDIALDLLKDRKVLGEKESELAKPYVNFPNPVFISPTFNNETIAKISDSNGYLYNDIFEIQSLSKPENLILIQDLNQRDRWAELLVNLEHAEALRSYLKYDQTTTNAMREIFEHAQEHFDTKTQLRPYTRNPSEKPFSALMFIPIDYAGALCRIWGSFLLQDTYWKNNFIILTLSKLVDYNKNKKVQTVSISEAEVDVDNNTNTQNGGYFELLQFGGNNECIDTGICLREEIKADDLKSMIIQKEKEALKIGKSLLLISGNVAKMGISLPCVDIVYMLDNGKEYDDIIQKQFRALTDNSGKKFGYIVDVNLKRNIEAYFIYDLEKDKQRPTKKMSQIFNNEERVNRILDLCNWGGDSFIKQGMNSSLDYESIMKDVRVKILGNLEKVLLDNLEKKIKNESDDFFSKNQKGIELFNILSRTSLDDKPAREDRLSWEQGQELKDKVQKEDKKDREGKKKTGKKPKTQLEKEFDANEKVQTLIKKKLFNIQQTFVNTLLFRNKKAIWDKTFTLSKVLEQYTKYKERSIGKVIECLCNNITDNKCGPSSNIYEAMYCELTSYLDKNHENTIKTMDILEFFFKNEPQIATTWNSYIESVIQSLETIKTITPYDDDIEDEQPAHEQPAPEQPVPEQPVPEQPVPEQPVFEQPVPEQPVPEQPVFEQPVPEQPVPEQPVPTLIQQFITPIQSTSSQISKIMGGKRNITRKKRRI